MSIETNCPHRLGPLGEDVTAIGTAPDGATRFAAALAASGEDLTIFVSELLGQPRDEWVEKYAAARPELVPSIFGVLHAVAGGDCQLELVVTDDGPDLVLRRDSGVVQLSVLALPSQ